tara:strand:- start:82 stop:459 length:378 start_codon:yes stop_codon:yes gene_type:complete
MMIDKKIPKELGMIKGERWNEYYADLDIPNTWTNVSYGNDALPSFLSEKDEHKAYQVWVDSFNKKERAINSKDIYGLDTLAPRFHVSLCYGENDLFSSNNFDEIVKWINENPKTKTQIELTKEYI